MYICNDCGRKFEDPIRCKGDTTEYWGVSYTNTYDGCPHCKSDNYIDEYEYDDDEE